MVLPWRARILVSSEGEFICRKRERDYGKPVQN
ncbi:hypothetical protein QBD01_005151 [Ochrobactrum sp. 19YEA23]|nr:hypothetical protein [Ochrobactrum sp. RH2CCR150]MDH7789100.1 hypothetical protein [Ochrobactrum sp. 19YEA23]